MKKLSSLFTKLKIGPNGVEIIVLHHIKNVEGCFFLDLDTCPNMTSFWFSKKFVCFRVRFSVRVEVRV